MFLIIRRKIIQNMTKLSDQSGTLSSAIDQLSAMEAQIREAESKLQQFRSQQIGQGVDSTANTSPVHLGLGAPHPWQPVTSTGVGRGQPVSPQTLNPVIAAPGGLGESWPVPTSRWQPQPAARFSHPPHHAHQSTVGEDKHARSVAMEFGTVLQPSSSSPASLPHQEAEGWGKMEAPCPVSESQKNANIGIGRGSSIRVLCAQAGLDWI